MTVGCSKPLIKAMLQRQVLRLMSQVPENEITIKGWWTTLTRPPLKKYKLIALALPYEENIFGLLNVIHPNISCICWCMRFHWINLNYLLIKIANLVILITVMELKGHNSVKIQNIYKCMCILIPTIFPPICSDILLSAEVLAAVSLHLEFLQLCSEVYMLDI